MPSKITYKIVTGKNLREYEAALNGAALEGFRMPYLHSSVDPVRVTEDYGTEPPVQIYYTIMEKREGSERSPEEIFDRIVG